MGTLVRRIPPWYAAARRYSSGSESKNATTTTCVHHCKLLVVGGGTGGTSVAWRFSKMLKPREIIVVEPSENHYYQPLFSLVGAGLKRVEQAARKTRKVLPPDCRWCCDSCVEFEPEDCQVRTQCGSVIKYEYMVVALGLQNCYSLEAALDDPKSNVSSIYSPAYCSKTWQLLSRHRGGHALFTYTRQPGKCPGAAQKIMYLAEHRWRKQKVRCNTAISYNTGGASLFGIEKYGKSLKSIAEQRCITINRNCELVAVEPCAATFQLGEEKMEVPYTFLHVAPPMCPPDVLRNSPLADETGFMEVNRETLQHTRYPNIFGLGDCTNTPNSKTAAAIGPQSYVVEQNLGCLMCGSQATAKYNGYGCCPMLTSYGKGILAEFKYDKEVWETFFFDQSKERRLFYTLQTQYFPRLYWNKLIKGKFNGTEKMRRIFNPAGK